MSKFLERFLTDPEFGDTQWMWVTQKPVLVNAVAEFAVFDESFHKYKLGKKRPYPLEPSCPSSRVQDDEVAVVIYERDEAASVLQENAWEFLHDNSSAIEASLNRKLTFIQKGCLTQLIEEELEGSPWEDHWEMIKSVIPDPEAEIGRFYKLVGISLATSGLDECAFVGFEFQTAWDKDHGLEIVMHKDRVLAKAGMTELMSPYGSIVDGIKSIQEYDFDLGDLKL